MKEKLKPCPFCGGKPYVEKDTEDNMTVDCQECFASGPFSYTEEEAIKAWNRRAK